MIPVKPKLVTAAVTASGTAVQFSTTNVLCYGLTITAKKATGVNTGNVFVGDSTVDATNPQGMLMQPGDVWEPAIPAGCLTNLANWYVDATNNNDGVEVIAYVPGK